VAVDLRGGGFSRRTSVIVGFWISGTGHTSDFPSYWTAFLIQLGGTRLYVMLI
jgi:hypothetical protein